MRARSSAERERQSSKLWVAGSNPAGFISRRRSPTGRGACLRNKKLGVRLPPSASVNAGVAQTADAPFLKIGRCGFESHLPHLVARVAQLGRGGGLKPRRLKVRIFPRASSSSTNRCSSNLSGALGKSGRSRLTFNQEMRGFESHTPRQTSPRHPDLKTSSVDRSSNWKSAAP